MVAEVAIFPRAFVNLALVEPTVRCLSPQLAPDEGIFTDAGWQQRQDLHPPGAARQSPSSDASQEDLAADQIFRTELVALIPSLRSFALRLCGSRDMADDLSQDAMMRGWAARSRYTLGTNLRAWLFTILRNQWYSNFRKAMRTTGWDDPGVVEFLPVQAPAQQDAIHLADVAKALLKLPWNQRQVLQLVGIDGASYEEAAIVVGCPMGTLKCRLSRGRKALALLIDGPADAVL
jgi:RNA polymerase sigma-70 factor (ECF subfamily)